MATTLPATSGVQETRCHDPQTRKACALAVGVEMKPVGEPDAGNPHVPFDERGAETELGYKRLGLKLINFLC